MLGLGADVVADVGELVVPEVTAVVMSAGVVVSLEQATKEPAAAKAKLKRARRESKPFWGVMIMMRILGAASKRQNDRVPPFPNAPSHTHPFSKQATPERSPARAGFLLQRGPHPPRSLMLCVMFSRVAFRSTTRLPSRVELRRRHAAFSSAPCIPWAAPELLLALGRVNTESLPFRTRACPL